MNEPLVQNLKRNTLRISNAARDARAALDDGEIDLADAYLAIVIAASDALEALEPKVVAELLGEHL